MGKKKRNTKLHIGCGSVYKKGYINIDAHDLSRVDLKALAHKLPYKNNTIVRIESFHLLEHLTEKECDLVLKEWYRVLKINGEIVVEVPDLIRNMETFLKASYSERWEKSRKEFNKGLIQKIYGLGNKNGQIHKTGFDKTKLRRLMVQYGFVDIKIKRSFS